MTPAISISESCDGVVTVTLAGVVAPEHLHQFGAHWRANPSLGCPAAVVIDASELDLREVTCGDIRSLAELRLPRGTRVAVIAGSALCYGLARMYEMLHEMIEPQSHVAVFHTAAGALCWLATGDPGSLVA